MPVKLQSEQYLEFLSLKGGDTSASESIHVKMPHCGKSHVVSHFTGLIVGLETLTHNGSSYEKS